MRKILVNSKEQMKRLFAEISTVVELDIYPLTVTVEKKEGRLLFAVEGESLSQAQVEKLWANPSLR